MEKNDFDRWYLVPKNGVSELSSRKQPNLDSGFFGLYPIISSPMAGISGAKLVIEMAKNNCLGILHKFGTYEERKENIDLVSKKNIPFGIAIGINDFPEEFSIAKYAVDRGAVMLCVDLANGYMNRLKYVGYELYTNFPNISLMSGNVVTKEGAEHLKECGFDFIRVGIGGGSNCQTREITGIGRNTMAALKDCSSVDAKLVADGGVVLPGNASKSFACGADFVMLGSALAHAKESERVLKKQKTLFGMASYKNHLLNNKEIKSIEGFETKIKRKPEPLKDILHNYIWGIRSACTYAGAWNYKEIQDRVNIISVDERI